MNEYFEKSFKSEVESNDENDDNFYRSYRQSTNVLYT